MTLFLGGGYVSMQGPLGPWSVDDRLAVSIVAVMRGLTVSKDDGQRMMLLWGSCYILCVCVFFT